jgi:hypothetical protein
MVLNNGKILTKHIEREIFLGGKNENADKQDVQ